MLCPHMDLSDVSLCLDFIHFQQLMFSRVFHQKEHNASLPIVSNMEFHPSVKLVSTRSLNFQDAFSHS